MTITKDEFLKEIKTHAVTPPWGYIKIGDGVYEADEEALKALSEAFDLLDNGESIRQTMDWLSKKGYQISKSGLHKLWRLKRPVGPREHKKKLELRREKYKLKIKNLPEEEKKLREKRKLEGNEKRRVAALRNSTKKQEKKIELTLEQQEQKVKELKRVNKEIAKSNVITGSEYVHEDKIEKALEHDGKEIVFKPNEGPQTEFLASDELEVLYGGAAGGGKSYALIADPMRYFNNGNFNGLLLRRTNDELRELIWNTKKLYPSAFGKDAVFSEKASEWRFKSGARLWMSYLDRDDDVFRYHGQAFTWIGFDELTQYPSPMPWDYLRSRLRSTDKELKNCLSMRATTNPGGPGHGWVKKMFIDPSPPGTPFWAQSLETNEILKDPDTNLPLFRRKFIPAKLVDNPYLYEDGIYKRNLLSLNESKKAQLLDGDWTIADGAAFPEFRTSKHVIKPFDIPDNWTKFRAADYGYSSFSCVLWFAIDPSDEQLVVYRELYKSKLTGETLANTVLEIERGDRVQYGVLDSSVWHKRGEGPSIAEVMINKGCRWRPSDRSQGSRVAGKNRLHELLKIDEFSGRPGIVFFDTCRQVIGDLQVIPADPKGSDDIDDRYKSDHSYDALRYGIMSRPRSVPWFMQDNPSYQIIEPLDRVFGY